METTPILNHSHSDDDGNNIQQMETAILGDHHIMIKNLADRVKISDVVVVMVVVVVVG